MFDCSICYHLESGWHVTRPNQGLSLGRGKSLGTRLWWNYYSDAGWNFSLGKSLYFLIMCLTLEWWFAVLRPIEYRCKFCKDRVYVYLLVIIITTLIMNKNGFFSGYDAQGTLSEVVAFVDLLLTIIFTLFLTWATYINLWQHSRKSSTSQQSNNR